MAIRLLVVAAVALMMTACATSRGELDIQVSEPPNPESGLAVKIVEVKDSRVFAIAPDDPATPSLKYDEIGDPRITERAVARKRNGYGMALGDILLPEGRSVSQLTKEVLVKALREADYKVVERSDSDYATALPLNAEITRFWSWVDTGFWALTLRFESEIQLLGDWPVSVDGPVRGTAQSSGMVATSEDWDGVIKQGLDDLAANLKARLQ